MRRGDGAERGVGGLEDVTSYYNDLFVAQHAYIGVNIMKSNIFIFNSVD